jgi:hypothetical protein
LGRDSIAMLCLLAERRLMVDGALSGGEADPEVYRQLHGALSRAGLRAAADQARDAHALARIAERRPASAPVAPAEHLQLFEEVA